ncbi:hypothetical protein [Stomatohabitans albus]|uniref:hypothetical protein n=1 Tax=Stomatohabitans albus TaxID=3110766 RepID=UPI00300DB8DF
MIRIARLLALLSLSILLCACQANVRTLIDFSRNGSGEISITATVDEELANLAAKNSADPLAVALERANSLGDGWKATSERFDSSQLKSVTLTAPFNSADELTQRIKQIEEGLNTNGFRLVGTYTIAEGEKNFTVDALVPFEVSDEAARAYGFTDAATLIQTHGTALTNEVVIRSSTDLETATVPTVPVDENNPDGQQEVVVTVSPGQQAQAQVTFAKGGRNWFIIIGGLILALLLFAWGALIVSRARSLASKRTQSPRRPMRQR